MVGEEDDGISSHAAGLALFLGGHGLIVQTVW